MHDTPELFYPERWTTKILRTRPRSCSGQNTGATGAAGITGPFSNPWLGIPGGDPFPSNGTFPASSTYVTIPPKVAAEGHILQWNLSYSRQFAKDWLGTATYIGNRTNHILGANDINVPQPSPTATTGNEPARRLFTLLNPTQGAFYSQVVQTDDGATASYNGLLLKAEHRFANHYTWLTNYTWSHCISTWDFGNELAATDYQNANNRNAEKGNCNFDRRHIFNTSLVATSAWFRPTPGQRLDQGLAACPDHQFEQRAVRYYHRWHRTFRSPATLWTEQDVVAGVNTLTHTTNQWFNPAAFAGNCALAAYATNPNCQAPGTFGNAGARRNRRSRHHSSSIWRLAVSSPSAIAGGRKSVAISSTS